MDSIELTQLRRIHAVDLDKLDGLKQHLAAGGAIEPIAVVRFQLPTGASVWVVSDGTHRSQAALELGRTTIACTEVSLARVQAAARDRGVDFDDLAHRAVRLRAGDYGMRF